MLIQISRKYMLVLLLCVQFLYGQSQDSIQPRTAPNSEKVLNSYKAYKDSVDLANMQKGMESSFRYMNEYQATQRKKQKQKAFMYIGFGVAMLGVLVYSMRRRKKQPKL